MISAPLPTTQFCDVCLDKKPAESIISCKSGHTLCREDVKRLYQNAVDTGSPVPPLCCRNNSLPIAESVTLLDEDLSAIVAEHTEKLQNEQKLEGMSSAESEDFLQLAKEEMYKKCPKCGTWIEKLYGCDDIECICGEHLCYSCGTVLDRCVCDINALDEISDEVRIQQTRQREREDREMFVRQNTVEAGVKYGFEVHPVHCRPDHMYGQWTRIKGVRQTDCCTNGSEQLRCERCGSQFCRN